MTFPFADPETFQSVRNAIDSDPRLQVDFINSIMDQLARILERSGMSGRVSILVNGY